jgi:uncharacterized membrane protein YwaF
VNYGFLRAKPANVSLFDFMPDWPRYIPILVAMGVASALIYYAPWFVADTLRKTARLPASAPARDS